ncbi:MAG: pyruvate, phosphate dikinase, partial [Terriglobales bacterium]
HRDFPQDAKEQLVMARDAVFRSWNNDRARHYRRINNISDDLGTAVNVQAMVFGNLGDTSGTGVGFTRNPANGTKEFYGEFLLNAQGEDVVSGVRTPVPILELEKIMPDVYNQLREITTRLEKHYKDMQDFEFTIQARKLYMLQTRNGKRTGLAAVRVALQMVDEGLIKKEEAIFRVDPNQLYDFLVPRLDEKGSKVEVLAKGLPASPGAAVGQIVFSADEAVEKAGHEKNVPVILVRGETTPEDIHGMEVAKGILTSRGGMTSHAAVVTRGMGKCCVAGAGDVDVDEKAREMRVKGQVFKAGDWISLDGTTGRVIKGKLNTLDPSPDDPELQKFMNWADPYRTIKVRANADIGRDAIQARAFGAEGIGLCRTEHMFFGEKKIPYMRAMILADNEKDRRAALKKLLPMQRKDFDEVFRAMDGFPVTIRTLDPPLHEFLPSREELMVNIATLKYADAKQKKSLVEMYGDYGVKAVGDLKKILPLLLSRVEQLHEVNPMLGHRGCRLGITYPEITEMQVRAIFEAAVTVAKDGVKVYPEVMIPLTATLNEMANQAAIVRRVANEVFKEKGRTIEYLVGTMIELPRAALIADEIAKEAEFFSFGTNDLTQTTWGFSRDDVNKILPTYLADGIIKQDPFAVLDREGVGQLVKMATERGRKTRPTLKVGICGEHGGEPSSVEFCYQTGLNYVSCSPFRVLTARLAAAQAAAGEKLQIDAGRTK